MLHNVAWLIGTKIHGITTQKITLHIHHLESLKSHKLSCSRSVIEIKNDSKGLSSAKFWLVQCIPITCANKGGKTHE
jgi:hypothetical protein